MKPQLQRCKERVAPAMAAVMVATALAVGAGCSTYVPPIYAAAGLNAEQAERVEQLSARAEPFWNARWDLLKLQKALELYSEVLEIHPGNLTALSRRAAGSFLLADTAGESSPELLARRRVLFRQGYEASDRYLRRLPKVGRALTNGDDYASAITNVTDSADLEVLAYKIGCTLIGSLDNPVRLGLHHKEIETDIDVLCEAGPDVAAGACLRLRAVYSLNAPKFSGRRSAEAAQADFLAAIERFPDSMRNKPAYALYFAGGGRDDDLYRKLLTEVVESARESNGALAPEDRLALRKARELFAALDR